MLPSGTLVPVEHATAYWDSLTHVKSNSFWRLYGGYEESRSSCGTATEVALHLSRGWKRWRFYFRLAVQRRPFLRVLPAIAAGIRAGSLRALSQSRDSTVMH